MGRSETESGKEYSNRLYGTCTVISVYKGTIEMAIQYSLFIPDLYGRDRKIFGIREFRYMSPCSHTNYPCSVSSEAGSLHLYAVLAMNW